MIVKNKLFKFSSLCIIGSITILVNQMMPTKAETNSYTDVSQLSGAASSISSTYNENSDINVINGGTTTNSSAVSQDAIVTIEDENVTVADTPTEEVPQATADPNAIPGIDYKEYMNKNDYTNLGIVSNVKTYLNVRSEASTESSNTIIAKIPPNAGCTVMETLTNSAGEEWCKIQSGEITGYVLKEYLTTGDEAQALVPSVGFLVIKVECEILNIREAASVDAEILYQIQMGEELKVVSVTDEWVEVAVDIGEETAYVSREYINFSFVMEKAIDVDEILVGCSAERTKIVAYAKQFLGNPYVYGGTNLYTGIDCSAYVRAIYSQFGYTLNRTSRDQCSSDGTKITEAQLQPGDLVFYANSSGTVKHVAMFIGNGKIIHASNPSDGIKISNMKYTAPYRYKNIIGDL